MSDFQEGLIDLGNGRVKVNFRKISEDGKHKYHDALHFSQAEYDALSEAQLEEMKQERFDKWYEQITNPPPSTESINEIENAPVLPLPSEEDYVIVNGVKYIKAAE